MLIIRFIDADGRVSWGRLDPDAPPGAARAYPMKSDPFRAARYGPRGAAFAADAFESDALRVVGLLPPVDPPNVFAIGLNYRKHAEEQGLTKLPEEPLVFLKATTAVIGPDQPIVLPRSAPDEVDFEAELAVVIGRRCRNVAPEDALSHVLGYTCGNDVSARDCQKRRDKQWARAKSFDTFCPLGPALAAADSFDPAAAPIRARLNGALMQDAVTSDLMFAVPTLVSFLSHQFTLLPGTVILTGTPSGVGFARTPPVYLRAGDVITIEIDAIGALSNPVRSESA